MSYKKEGKPDTSYLPGHALLALTRVLEVGGGKHGRDNYLTNPDVTDLDIIGALGRHWIEILKGNLMDDGPGGTNESHAACIMANAAMLEERRHRNSAPK